VPPEPATAACRLIDKDLGEPEFLIRPSESSIAADEVQLKQSSARSSRKSRSRPPVIKRARHNSYRLKCPTGRSTHHPYPSKPLLACLNCII